MRLTDEVRGTAAQVAAEARCVRIDPEVLEHAAAGRTAVPPALDPGAHLHDPEPEHGAIHLLCLDTNNLGSGWWPTIRKRPGMSGYFTMAAGLTERFRHEGPYTAGALRAVRTEEVADALGQARDHELMALYAQ